MATIGIARIGVEIRIGDKEYVVNEGDCITGLRFMKGKTEYELDGCVRVICAKTSNYAGGPTSCPPEPYVSDYVKPTSLIIDSSTEHAAALTQIAIADIVSIEKVGPHDENIITIGPGSQYRPVNDVIAEAEPGAVIELLPGTYEEELTLGNDVTLLCSADTEFTKPITISGDATISGGRITGPLTINAPGVAAVAAAEGAGTTPAVPSTAKVYLVGVELTNEATLSIGEVDSFIMTECNLHDHVFNKDKGYLVHFTSETPAVVIIEGNTFGPEPDNSYNLIECLALLKTGSSISENFFDAKCCKHNQINIYNADNGAVIDVNKNTCEYSANLVRVGLKGAAVATINMNGNICKDTDLSDDAKWSGLFLIQPYGSKTTSMKGLTIYMMGNDVPAGSQIGYLYSAGSEMKFTAETSPTIHLNDQVITIPDASPIAVPMSLRV